MPNEFTEIRATGEFRRYSPNPEWVPPVWQQKFYCKDANGNEGYLWFNHPSQPAKTKSEERLT